MAVWARGVALACILAAAGCTYQTNGSGPGTLTVRQPLAVPQPPPPQMPPPDGGTAAPLLPDSGTYAGIGHLRGYRGLGCENQIRVTGFQVNGTKVRYTRFRGTIQPDLSLSMQAGDSYVRGQFNGDTFTGLFHRYRSCSYNVELTK